MGKIDWKDETVKVQKPKGVNYSTFKTCSNVTEDRFWKIFFTKCGSGDLPEGFNWICKERLLVYECNDEEIYYKIPRDKNEACQKLIEIFENHGVVSPSTDEDQIKTFSDAKGANISNLIDNYINTQRDQYKLSPDQVRVLALKILHLRLKNKLDNSTVVMSKGVIESIESLRYKPKTGQWVID